MPRLYQAIILPVVKTWVTSTVNREVAGSSPAAGTIHRQLVRDFEVLRAFALRISPAGSNARKAAQVRVLPPEECAGVAQRIERHTRSLVPRQKIGAGTLSVKNSGFVPVRKKEYVRIFEKYADRPE